MVALDKKSITKEIKIYAEGTRMSIPKVMAIHAIVMETVHSKPQM